MVFYAADYVVCVCLSVFVQAKAIMLCSEPFFVENGLLTPSFKLKKVALKNRFMETLIFYQALQQVALLTLPQHNS